MAEIVAAIIVAVVGPLLVLHYKRKNRRDEPEATRPSQVPAEVSDPTEAEKSYSPVRGIAVDAQGYPDFMRVHDLPSEPQTMLREQSPRQVFLALEQLPPLSRRRAAEESYIGRWVDWTGEVGAVIDRGELLAIIVALSDESSFHVMMPVSSRPYIEHLREGDRIRVRGQVRTMDAPYFELVRAEVFNKQD